MTKNVCPFLLFTKREMGILHDESCHTHIVSCVCLTYLDYLCVTRLDYVCVTCLDTVCVTVCVWHDSTTHMGWLWLVGSIKL